MAYLPLQEQYQRHMRQIYYRLGPLYYLRTTLLRVGGLGSVGVRGKTLQKAGVGLNSPAY